MITKALRSFLLAGLGSLVLACSARAVNFDLFAVSASNLGGNPGDSGFLHVNGNGTTAGTMGDSVDEYFATVGGDEDAGFWVKIDFNGLPQPVLTSAFLKSSTSHLLWDATDLAAFNAGTFTSITLWNSDANGIMNDKGKFKDTSHSGLFGTAGTSTNVPDDGVTMILLGAAVTTMGVMRRFARR